MIKKLSFLLLILIFGCQQKNNLPITISISKNWQFKGIDTLNWQAATVPGNVYTDLLNHKIIENPFIKNNEEKVQWVCKKDWEYKTTFTLSDEILQNKNIELIFDGLDTYATIFLNNSFLGKTENAFKKYTFKIDVLAKKENNLKIIFKNTNYHESLKEDKNPYKLPEGKRIYTRKAQFQYGWDWGPKLNTAGIWKGIFITAWNDYKIKNIYIQNNSISETEAILTINIEDKNYENKNLKYEVFINNKLQALSSEKPEIPITIKNPKLWWTHNLGTPYLYDIKVVVKKDTQILDSITTKYGIRTLELINKKDKFGESFGFELNGKPVYMKGANYIPQNSFQNKVSNQHYKKLLSDVVETNMNMLRVWGGGIYENDIFYDLCDKKGILVWQDFMFACAMYPGDKKFLQNVTIEAEQQVKRLRNHASIALWCGNNENSEGWKYWGWQASRTEKEKKEIWKDYLAVFDSILPSIVVKFSETDYWKTSPKYGRGNPKFKTEGDAHDWWIWHDNYPFEHLQNNVPRFMSEFGFQAFPSFETINYINQKDTVDLKTDAIKSHQKHTRGFQLIDKYMARNYNIPTNDEDYTYVSQLLQAKGIIIGIEAQRKAKPYNMGTLFWQLNDCWPAISWSSIDYFGNWKALQYKAKKAFKNILISYKEDKFNIKTYVINDTFKTIKDSLKMKIIDFKGNEIWSYARKKIVNPNVSQQVFSIPNVDIDRLNYVYITEFNGHKSFYYFEKPKNLNLPKGKIAKQITKTQKGFLITLKSSVLQKDVFLHTQTKGRFSDNFFDLLPNEIKTLFFETDVKSLKDLKIKTLNNIY